MKNKKKQNDNIVLQTKKRFNRLIKKENPREIKFIGCSPRFLRFYISTLFYGNISWNNYNSLWTIDFIKPMEEFNFLKKGEQAKCYNWKNLRPKLKKGEFELNSKRKTLKELLETFQPSTF